MKENNEIIINRDEYKQRDTTNPDKATSNNSFKFYRDGTRWGILAGVGMAAFLVLIQLGSMGDSIGLKFFNYLALALVLAFGLSIQRNYLQEEYNFKNGIMLGAYMTFVSAISLALMNILIFFTTDNLAFDKFSMEGNTFGNVMLVNGVLFFEVLVFGMIATFICLQFIKPKRPSAKLPS